MSLYPDNPEPIRIDRFIEKRFNISPKYEVLPPGVLGYTQFGSQVEAIVVSQSLAEDQTPVSRRRVNTTLAHEAGHGFLHAYLFMLASAKDITPFLTKEFDVDSHRILCRDDIIHGTEQGGARRRYAGRWWEFQANKAMGALLLPRELVIKCLDTLLVDRGSFGEKWLTPGQREAAAQKLVSAFDVNPIVGRLRLQTLYPEGDEQQLTF
ncbi:MAG: hypothetical protein KKH28_05625 [Elusimicrobia bacterium]|nr:hypothetical protein [Elusimicrobiota bacterium]